MPSATTHVSGPRPEYEPRCLYQVVSWERRKVELEFTIVHSDQGCITERRMRVIEVSEEVIGPCNTREVGVSCISYKQETRQAAVQGITAACFIELNHMASLHDVILVLLNNVL